MGRVLPTKICKIRKQGRILTTKDTAVHGERQKTGKTGKKRPNQHSLWAEMTDILEESVR